MTNESKRFFIFELALAAAGAACLLYAGLGDADAQDVPKCAPIADMRAALLKDYHEVELAGGLISEQDIVIIFATPDGATWTAVALGATGKACVMTAGQNWFQSDLQKGDPV